MFRSRAILGAGALGGALALALAALVIEHRERPMDIDSLPAPLTIGTGITSVFSDVPANVITPLELRQDANRVSTIVPTQAQWIPPGHFTTHFGVDAYPMTEFGFPPAQRGVFVDSWGSPMSIEIEDGTSLKVMTLDTWQTSPWDDPHSVIPPARYFTK